MAIKFLLNLGWKSLCFRRNAVFITVAAIAVSVFTLLSVEHLRHTAKQSFNSTVSGVDLIVGPRTGDINLLLSTIFRIGQPSQSLSWQSYSHIAQHSDVAWTIPISLGDSHRSFRVVGTETSFFTRFQYGQSRGIEFSQGKAFALVNEVVVGSSVAAQLGYQVGQKLVISHGLANTSFQTHDTFPFQVSGVLKPTGTPVDNALYVSLAGLEAAHGLPAAYAENTQLSSIEPKSISAVLVGLHSKLSTFKIQRELNQFSDEALTAILPGVALTKLWQISRGIEGVFSLMAKLILFAALLGLSAVVMATLRERFYELSVLRTLGAGRATIVSLIQIEIQLISLLGVLLGAAVFVIAVALFSGGLASAYGIDVGLSQLSLSHGMVVVYVLAGSLVVGILPAVSGYIYTQKLS